MNQYLLTVFGSIPLDAPEEFYDGEAVVNGQNISLDLNLEGPSIAPERLDGVRRMLGSLPEQDACNRQWMEEALADGEEDTIRMYIDHHLELAGAEPEDADPLAAPDSRDAHFIRRLQLVRVGFYPDSDEGYTLFDYSIDPALTDYLIVVRVDAYGELEYLALES